MTVTNNQMFAKISASFGVAAIKKGFLQNDFSLTTDREKACPVEMLFHKTIDFLITSTLSEKTSLTEKQVTLLMNNIRNYAKHAQSRETNGFTVFFQNLIQNQLAIIENLLKNGNSTKAKLESILSKRHPSHQDLLFLQRCLSYLHSERYVLKEANEFFATESRCEQVTREGLERDLIFYTIEEGLPEKTAPLVLPPLDPSFDTQNLLSAEMLHKLVHYLMGLKQAHPHESDLIDTFLLSLKLYEFFNQSQQKHQNCMPVIKIGIDLDQAEAYPLFPSLMEALLPSISYFSRNRAVLIGLLNKFQSEGKFLSGLEQDPSCVLSLHEEETLLTTFYGNKLRETSELYHQKEQELCNLYQRIYVKITRSRHPQRYTNNTLMPESKLFTPEEFSSLSIEHTLVPTMVESLLEQLLLETLVLSLESKPQESAPANIQWVDIAKRKPQRTLPKETSPSLSLPEKRLLPRKGLELNPHLLEIARKHFNYLEGRTLVFATDGNQLRVAKSSRFFSLSFVARKEHQLVQENAYHFSQREIDPKTIKQLFATMKSYYQDKLLDIPYIQDKFAYFLFALFRESRQKAELFATVHSLYRQALTKEQWVQLKNLLISNRLSQFNIERIVKQTATKESALIMKIAQMSCGEMKIALDCIEEASLLSPSEKARLPQTLSERLQFVALINVNYATPSILKSAKDGFIPQIPIGDAKFYVLNPCPRCENIWGVFERRYQEVLKPA